MYEVTILTVWFNEMFSGFRTIPYVALQILGVALPTNKARAAL